MLDIVDELNLTGLSDEDILVSFDITNMFPSIDNRTGIERVYVVNFRNMLRLSMCLQSVLLKLWKSA
jgi:hypothetical protein